jgi:GntP family gluconate:H+ symporter
MILGYFHKKSVVASNTIVSGKQGRLIRDVLLNDWVSRGLQISLGVLLLTGMSGGFSFVIRSAPAIDALSYLILASPIPGILIPFMIGGIMMTAVGSMTMAGITAAAIVLPMMGGLGISPVAAAIAIGAGTLWVNHVNNSGFWVMCQFFNLNTKQGFKYVTLPCIIAAFASVIVVAVFSGAGLM